MRRRARILTALAALAAATASFGATAAEKPGELVLWYDRPAADERGAEDWNAALPVGNGRLGAMVFGGVASEHLQINEDSVWYGGPRDRNNPDARTHLDEIRSLLRAGHVGQAEGLARMAMIGLPENQRHFEPFADVRIEMNHGGEPSPGSYRRELDLARAVATTRYTVDGVAHTREVYATAADQVIVVRFRADKPRSIGFSARLRRQGEGQKYSHYLDTGRKDGDRGVIITGNCGAGGVAFCGGLRAKTLGGSVRVIGDTVIVEGASEALLIVGGATSFYHKDPDVALREQLDRAFVLSADVLLARHFDAHRRFFERVSMRFEGGGDRAALPTDERLQRVAGGEVDTGLVALYFQYGRYLLLSCSRPGTQPANLQGLWNQSWLPPWDSKYTININTEMNYWPAEVANLAELHEPLFALLERMREPGRRTARAMYGARGFVAHHNTDLWGDTAPQGIHLPATIWPMGAAWLSTHLWEAFLFGGDRDFLRRAYPVMREASEFFFDYLTEDAAGRLVTGPSVSPENTYVLPCGERGALCLGPSMDSQIIEHLLRATIAAARVLGMDEDFCAQAEEIRARLPKPAIGRDGRLMEWSEHLEEAEPGHRHISHLWALHPGDAISPGRTPQLAAAARATLEHRLAHGGGHTGWSRAWIINFWARLLDGAKAGENVQALLAKSTYPNLLDAHPPFQIDGNLGGAAGIAEMLLQSCFGPEPGGAPVAAGDAWPLPEAHLLPALPPEWPAGRVTGLRARGGFEVDIEWREGRLVEATVRSKRGGRVRLRCGDAAAELDVPPGGATRWTGR